MHTRLVCVALALALVAAPAIVLAGGGSVDSGYETSAATVDVVDQSVVSLSPASGSNGQYAEVAANGELALRFQDINEDAETTADRVFSIEATGSGTTGISVESDTSGVSFYWGSDPGANASEPQRLDPGETATVGVRVDSYDGVGDGDFTVIAEQAAQQNERDVSVVDANVSPTEITVGESVNATATLYNAGSSATPYRVQLAVDGTVIDNRIVSVPAGSQRTVAFERTFQQPGEFAVEVAGREAGTVTVLPNETEDGGGFVISNASIAPSTIQPGEAATITADVTNRGGAGEVFTAELAVGGSVVEERAVEVAPGETATVSFERSFERRGGYEISISGAEAGTVRVESSTAASMRRYGSEWGWLLGVATVPTLGAAFVAARRRGRFVRGE